ncbi:MAG: diguanylate cyclase domain-containing protein [Thermodesulfobacteriota bacterium]
MSTYTSLAAQDLILYEELLASKLSQFLNFSSGNLYFPRNIPSEMKSEQNGYIPMYRQRDNKLFIPLVYQFNLLGIFLAQDVSPEEYHGMESRIAKVAELCLENLAMQKAKQTDTLTSLYNKEYFLSLLKGQIESISESFFKRYVDDSKFADFAAHFGLILINLDNLCNINTKLGYQFGDRTLCNIANTLKKELPLQATAARLEADNFAVLLPETSLAKSNRIAENLREKILQTEHIYQPTQEAFKTTCSLATIHYPGDFSVQHSNKDFYEQAFLLLEQAHQGLDAAKQRGKNLVQPYSEILKRVGLVSRILTPNRVQVNIGSNLQAAAGQRYQVVSGDRDLEEQWVKGEVILVDIKEHDSTAEILHHNHPGSNLEPGDRIVYANQDHSIRHFFPDPGSNQSSGQKAGEILPLHEFIKYWHQHSAKSRQFCMILCRITEHTAQVAQNGCNNKTPDIYLDLYEALKACLPSEGRIGEYSTDSLILYLPDTNPAQAMETASRIHEQSCRAKQSSLTLGISFHPCSHFNRTDMLINCRKAFEHALLLPSPQIALFNSTSLTISADRHFTNADLANAIEEYKTALLLDPGNHTARNSLGICYAKLGQLSSAFQEFKRIAEEDPDNHYVLYNLGYTYLKLDCIPEAEQCFCKCLEQSGFGEKQHQTPEQVFSLLRLGEIAEKNQDPEKAKGLYKQALDMREGAGHAQRFLGNLEFKQENWESSKNHLHQALVHNPRDAEAMYLLAKIYLEQGEDPEVAQSLAQKSIGIRPHAEHYRELLRQALLSQDKTEEAEVLQNSMNNSPKQESFPLLT